jgi:hypothetical protein
LERLALGEAEREGSLGSGREEDEEGREPG